MVHLSIVEYRCGTLIEFLIIYWKEITQTHFISMELNQFIVFDHCSALTFKIVFSNDFPWQLLLKLGKTRILWIVHSIWINYSKSVSLTYNNCFIFHWKKKSICCHTSVFLLSRIIWLFHSNSNFQFFFICFLLERIILHIISPHLIKMKLLRIVWIYWMLYNFN